MMKSLDLNRIKLLLINLLKSHGLTDDDLNGYDEEKDTCNWRINWKEDFDDEFMGDLRKLQAALDLYEKGLAGGDLLAAKAGLLRASISAHGLVSFFDAIKNDLDQVLLDKRMNWPKFPEDYKIPSKYGYKR